MTSDDTRARLPLANFGQACERPLSCSFADAHLRNDLYQLRGHILSRLLRDPYELRISFF